MSPQNRAASSSTFRIPILLSLLCLTSTVTLEATQDMTLQGAVFERTSDGATSDPVTEAAMQFFDDGGTLAARTTTARGGKYQVVISPGSYRATIKADGYETADTEFRLNAPTDENDDRPRTRNFFLEPMGADVDAGRQGRVFERLPDGGIGPVIPGAAVQFIAEDGTLAGRATTDSNGAYRVILDPGRYRTTAKATGYETYTSGEGYSVVTLEDGVTTLNFFLHAVEADDGEPQDPGPSGAATGRVGGSVRVGSGTEAFRLNFNAEADPLGGTIRYAPAGGAALRGNVDVCYNRDGNRVVLGGTLTGNAPEPYFEVVLEDHGQGRNAPRPDRAGFQMSSTPPDCEDPAAPSAIARGNVDVEDG